MDLIDGIRVRYSPPRRWEEGDGAQQLEARSTHARTRTRTLLGDFSVAYSTTVFLRAPHVHMSPVLSLPKGTSLRVSIASRRKFFRFSSFLSSRNIGPVLWFHH